MPFGNAVGHKSVLIDSGEVPLIPRDIIVQEFILKVYICSGSVVVVVVMRHFVLYSIVQYCTVLYSIVQYV